MVALPKYSVSCCPAQVTATEAVVRDPAAAAAPPAGSADANGDAAAAAAAAAGGGGRVVHPIVAGSIEDWDVLEACLDHVLYDRVGGWMGA